MPRSPIDGVGKTVSGLELLLDVFPVCIGRRVHGQIELSERAIG
jgi:hypothetical protein